MKTLFAIRLAVVIVILFCTASAFAQYPGRWCYIGLYIDEYHSTSHVIATSPFHAFELWTWCLPSDDGQVCARFSVDYPSNVIISGIGPVYNDDVSTLLGDPETGLELCYGNCHTEWNWPFHQTIYIVNLEPSVITLVKHLDYDAIEFINCEPPGGLDTPIVLSDLGINHISADTLPPVLIDASVFNPSTIVLTFDETLHPSSAEDKDNYRVYRRDDPSSTIPVFDVNLYTCGTTSDLTLNGGIPVNEPYRVEACNIADLHGNVMDSCTTGDLCYCCDLRIYNMHVTYRYQGSACTEATVQFDLENANSAVGADSITISAELVSWSGDSTVTWEIDTFLVNHLAPGEWDRLASTFIIPSWAGLDNSVIVTLDYLERIHELDEDNNTGTVHFSITGPRIVTIDDVPDDDGGAVSIRFGKALNDDEAASPRVISYEIQRRIDPVPGHAPPPSIVHPSIVEWEKVDEIQADQTEEYTVVEPTEADSTAEHGIHWSVFRIKAMLDAPGPPGPSCFLSCPDSGYSLDNSIIAVLLEEYSIEVLESAIEVTWQLTTLEDDIEFLIFRAEKDASDLYLIEQAALERNGSAFKFTDRTIEHGCSYRYRIEYDMCGTRRILFETGFVSLPALSLMFYPNYPNPFNPMTTLKYYLPAPSPVRLDVYDLSGRRVVRLVDANEERGYHSAAWHGCNEIGKPVSSGVYFCTLRAGKRTITRKLVLLH